MTRPHLCAFCALLVATLVQNLAVPVAPAQDSRLVDQYSTPLPTGARARLGTLHFRHGHGVYFVGFADGGKQLVTADRNHIVHVWDCATGKELRRMILDGERRTGRSRWSATEDVFEVQTGSNDIQFRILLSPDGGTLAAISWKDNTVQLWDVAAGKKLRQFRTMDGYDNGFCFSPDGKHLVVRGEVPWLFEVATGKNRRLRARLPDNIQRLRAGPGDFRGAPMALAPDSKTAALVYFASDADDCAVIEIIDVATGNQLHCFNGPQVPHSLNVTDDNTLVLSDYGNIFVYDPKSGKKLQQFKLENTSTNRKHFVAVSPDSKWVAVKVNSAAATIYELATGKVLRRLGDGDSPFDGKDNDEDRRTAQEIAFSPDGKCLAVGSPAGAARLWEITSGKEVVSATGHLGTIAAVSVSADGKTVTTVAADCTLRQWDSHTGKELRAVQLPARSSNPHFSADGRLVVFGCTDNQLDLWDVAIGKKRCTLDAGNAWPLVNQIMAGAGGLAFSADGKQLVARDFEGQVRRFDTHTGKEITAFYVRNSGPCQPNLILVNGETPGIAFASNDRTVATVSTTEMIVDDKNGIEGSNLVRLWDPATGQQVAQLTPSKSNINALKFAPDGRSLATANADQTVTVWETITGHERIRLAIKHDGNPGNAVTLHCLEFSPDGRMVAAGSSTGNAYLWELRTGKMLAEFSGHRGAVRSLAFSHDGRTLVTGSADSTALVYAMTPYLPAKAPAVELANNDLESRWRELSGDDASKAFGAVDVLSRSARQSLPFLAMHIAAVPAVDPDKVKRLLGDLDSKAFAVRQAAEEELTRLGEVIEADLRKALEGKPALEVRLRLENVQKRIVSRPSRQLVLSLRTLEVLEQIGTAEARQVLQSLSQGARGARLTREAETALKRLNARDD